MKREDHEPRGEDAQLQQQFFDMVLPLENIKDGFDPHPRSLDPAISETTTLPAGHIAFQGDFMPDETNYVLFISGKPASGKTTISHEFIQSVLPSISPGLTIGHISVGDTLRGIMQGEIHSVHSSNIKSYSEELSSARPLPNSLVASVVKEVISRRDDSVVLLDGYPRFPNQIEECLAVIREVGRTIIGVIEFDVPDEVVVERMSRRAKRASEAAYDQAVINARLQEYHSAVAETVSILSSHANTEYEKIDATTTVEAAARSLGYVIMRRLNLRS